MPPKPKPVRMVDPSGVVKDVHPADVAYVSTPIEEGGRGYSVETPEQSRLREYQTEKGSSVAESLKAVGEHAASTLTFGGSDLALSQIPGYNEQRQFRDVDKPISGAVGMVGSTLVPFLGQASKLGTAAKVAKVAGAPLSTVSRGSMALGGAVERALAGEAPTVARRLLAKGAGGAVSGATEGAAIGAGQALSESSIQDKRLTAELLLARMGEGASVGGVLGGALGGAGELFGLVGRGTKGALKFVPGVGEIVGQDAQQLAHSKALAALGFQRSNMKSLIKKYGQGAVDEMGEEAFQILEMGKPGAFKRALGYDMAEGAERVGAVKAQLNDDLKGLYRTLDETGERAPISSVVSRVDDELIAPLKASLSGSDEAVVREIKRELKPLYQSLERADKFASAARAVPEVKTRLTELGNLAGRREYEELSVAARTMRSELDGLRDSYKSMGLHEAANRVRGVSRALGAVEKTDGRDIFTKMSKLRDSYNLLDDSVASAVAKHGSADVSYSQLWELARKQAEKVKNFSITRDPKEAAYRQYWGILKDELAKQAERSGVGPQLQATNRRLKRVIALDEVASQSASFAGNRSISLTDTIAGAGGFTAAGPVGGIVGGTVNRFIRSAAGDELLGIAANRYATLRKAVDTADDSARAISRDVKDAITPARVKQQVTGVAARLAGQFEGQRQLVLSRNSEQERLLEELNSRMAEAQDVAPELASALTETAARGSGVLSADMPQPIGTGDIRDQAETPDIPDSEKAAWLRKLGVVREPTSVIRSLKKGELTGEEIDTLQRSHPALYGRMKADLLQHLQQNAIDGKAPNYQQRAQASVFTGSPVDATYSPDMIRAFQQRYAQAPQEQQQAPAPRRSFARASKLAERRTPQIDREA
jgi:hypothetical protein